MNNHKTLNQSELLAKLSLLLFNTGQTDEIYVSRRIQSYTHITYNINLYYSLVWTDGFCAKHYQLEIMSCAITLLMRPCSLMILFTTVIKYCSSI